MIGYCVDVSRHNDPAALPWEMYRGNVDVVIVRAANGTTIDSQVGRHIPKARGIGAKVGTYQFFRHQQPVADQFVALQVAADREAGDIVPALDIEDDTPNGQLVCPSWAGPAEELVGRIAEEWGDCMIYVTQRDWGRLGKPVWLLHRPLFIAHFTTAAKPATPAGMPAVLWQHRVGFFDPHGPGGEYDGPKQPKSVPTAIPPKIDQSRILAPLPLVGSRITDEDRERVAQLVALSLADEARGIDQNADTIPPPSELA